MSRFTLTVAPINQDGDGGLGVWLGDKIVAVTDEYGTADLIGPTELWTDWPSAVKEEVEKIALSYSELFTIADSGG